MSRPENWKERFAAVVALIVERPRTVPELEEITGYHHRTLNQCCHALEAEGLVSQSLSQQPTDGGPRPIVYTWSPQ